MTAGKAEEPRANARRSNFDDTPGTVVVAELKVALEDRTAAAQHGHSPSELRALQSVDGAASLVSSGKQAETPTAEGRWKCEGLMDDNSVVEAWKDGYQRQVINMVTCGDTGGGSS